MRRMAPDHRRLNFISTVTAVKHSTNISQIKTDGTFYQQIKNENQGYRLNYKGLGSR